MSNKQQADQQKQEQGKNGSPSHERKNKDVQRKDVKENGSISNDEPEELPGQNDDSKKVIRETPKMNSL